MGIAFAVFDFFQVTALAGAGLLFATWRGVGLGLQELLADSGLSLMALAAVVLFLDLLFIALLRRKPPAVSEKRSRGRK